MHDDIHVTRELLEAVATAELPPKVLVDLVLHHLVHLCPHCRTEFEAFSQGKHHVPATRRELDASLELVRKRLAQAQKWLDELKRLDPDERVGRVERARTRFRGQLFTRLLLKESRAHLPDDPRKSHTWARAALASVFYATGQDDLFVLAVSYQANASRLLGDVRGAREGFAWARQLIQQRGVTDLEIYAEVDRLQASLHHDLRAFDEAEQLLSRSAMLYDLLKDREGNSIVLMKLSNLYLFRGDIAEALQLDRQVLEMVSPERDPRLYLGARFNLAHHLVEAGEVGAARDLLTYDEDLYEQYADETTRINLSWLTGRIASAVGDYGTAERELTAARDAYAKRANGFDVACICLDLALLYHREEETEKLTEVASQAVVLFEKEEVHRDALAALILLRDAARAETLTRETIEKVARFLKDARTATFAGFESAN